MSNSLLSAREAVGKHELTGGHHVVMHRWRQPVVVNMGRRFELLSSDQRRVLLFPPDTARNTSAHGVGLSEGA